MLVLRRTQGQSIVIGSDEKIIVKILREKDGVISLGVDAPKSVPVDRFEIYERRHKNLPKIDDSNASLTMREEFSLKVF